MNESYLSLTGFIPSDARCANERANLRFPWIPLRHSRQTVLDFKPISNMIHERDMVVVLGSGYVARFMLFPTTVYARVLYTSRDPDNHLAWIPHHQRIRFDLAQPDTWKNLPSDADMLWCFPAAPPEAVRALAQGSRRFGKLVVLGSTSAYDVGRPSDYPPPWIDETSPIDLSKPRVQGEEFLRHECGAILLRAAGIYGPGRHPYNWIKSGRVTLSDKYVNLIHVEDLAAICLAALQCGVAGAVYNVSNGVPQTWRDIGRRLYGDQTGHPTTTRPPQDPGKRISTAKLRTLLDEVGIEIRHPDLFSSLERLRDDLSPS